MRTIPRVTPTRKCEGSPHSAALAMAPLLRLASLKVSDWHIVSQVSLTVSFGEALDFEEGFFAMTLTNRRTSQKLALTGAGFGASLGLPKGPPITVSGNPQAVADLLPNSPLSNLKKNLTQSLARSLPQLPGWQSPIFLCPGRIDSPQLFDGCAQVTSAAVGGILELGVGIIAFLDTATFAEDALMAAAGPIAQMLAGSPGAPVKAFAFLAGLDYVSGLSAGGGDILYKVSSRLRTTAGRA
jgi:hypothetical protein